MEPANNNIEMALCMLQEAMGKDAGSEYAEAFRLYQLARESFLEALQGRAACLLLTLQRRLMKTLVRFSVSVLLPL